MNGRELQLLFRDADALVIQKPAGLQSVPGRPTASGQPAERSAWELVQELEPSALPVHRLDRGTSGVLLFAVGKAAHRALSLSFEGRRAEKRYLALVASDLAAKVRCDAALHQARRGGMRLATPGEKGAMPSRTEVVPLERFSGLTWVAAHPHTGRTHQIRLHLASLGHPLALDPRYGEDRPLLARDLDPAADEPEAVVLARTPLHAEHLRIPHPSGAGWLQVDAPLPEDLLACLSLLRRARRGT